MRRSYPGLLAAGVPLWLLAGCSGDRADARTGVTVRDSAGIRIVESQSPALGHHVGVRELRIGEVEGEGPYTFGRLSSLAVSADGRMVVLDALALELRVFAPSGEWLAGMGSRGSGPAELLQPTRLWLQGDTVVVHDGGNRKLASWTLDGTFLGSRPFGVGAGAPLGATFEPVGDGRFLATSILGCLRQDQQSLQWTRTLTDGEGLVTDTLDVRAGGASLAVMIHQLCTPVSLPFGAELQLERGPDGRWAVGDGRSYEIRIGRLRPAARRGESAAAFDAWFDEELRVRRRTEPRPLTAADRRAHREAAVAAAREDRRAEVDALLAGYDYPDTWAAYTRLRRDDSGRLWVLRSPNPLPSPTPAVARPARQYDVYDARGRLLFEATLPAALHAARDDHVWAIELDADTDVPFIARYRLVPRAIANPEEDA